MDILKVFINADVVTNGMTLDKASRWSSWPRYQGLQYLTLRSLNNIRQYRGTDICRPRGQEHRI